MSSACYFYAMSPLLHVKSKVMGVHQNSLQGDVAFLDVLADMGRTISDEADGIVCMPPKMLIYMAEAGICQHSQTRR